MHGVIYDLPLRYTPCTTIRSRHMLSVTAEALELSDVIGTAANARRRHRRMRARAPTEVTSLASAAIFTPSPNESVSRPSQYLPDRSFFCRLRSSSESHFSFLVFEGGGKESVDVPNEGSHFKESI